MRTSSLWFALAGLGVAVFVACSADPPVNRKYAPYGSQNVYTGIQDRAGNWNQSYNGSRTSGVRQATPHYPQQTQSLSSIYNQVNVRKDYLSYGSRGRSRKSMNPQYITIHSTQNWSQGADANRHALALKRGALGRISWHFTTDEYRAVQHLPTNEQGNHADYDGPGNRYSIGIEMCEHPGNSRSATLDRTAKLAAWLCLKYDLPASRVVPHYKWPRYGKKPPNKNCPHFLLNNGRPGTKWANFVKVVDVYRRRMGGR